MVCGWNVLWSNRSVDETSRKPYIHAIFWYQQFLLLPVQNRSRCRLFQVLLVLHVSGTHRCSPLVYLHLKRSIFLQLKLYTWVHGLATGVANPKVSPKLLDGSCSNCAGWQEVPVSDCSLEEGIPVRFVTLLILITIITL